MIFYIAYRLKRKNARRKIAAKVWAPDVENAKRDFDNFVKHDETNNKQWELLTGDWKHIKYNEGNDENEK